ncbi:hypothetical protein [Leptospirillum ferriphilum]|uniref:Uncharacterized protein n=1 Tax=Leptospirillum ferriphilum TaxID=178606 RepID=A0A1V3SYX5_9BACT|nr:hypothetical protein [Leptospirillum ferriphilum]OOH75072.1 hypothetical protein BOX24_00610 [Leptospirillum ferriphilum]OOH78497.1 hypothetical protein BOX30_08210 [Leptospirillum ferriphilum]
MKRLIGNVLNGTIGFLETIRDQSKELIEKGEKNNGPFAKIVHKAFSGEGASGQQKTSPWIEKTLHAMNIATKDDLESLRREWERKNSAGVDGKP